MPIPNVSNSDRSKRLTVVDGRSYIVQFTATNLFGNRSNNSSILLPPVGERTVFPSAGPQPTVTVTISPSPVVPLHYTGAIIALPIIAGFAIVIAILSIIGNIVLYFKMKAMPSNVYIFRKTDFNLLTGKLAKDENKIGLTEGQTKGSSL
jgi:hypothetical protein